MKERYGTEVQEKHCKKLKERVMLWNTTSTLA